MPTTDYSNDVAKGARTPEPDSVAENTKYSVLYEPGLEIVNQDKDPEAVSTSNLDRKSSLLYPEPHHTAPYYSDKPEHHKDYEAPHAFRSEYEGLHTYGGRYEPDSKQAMVGEQEGPKTKGQTRCCGLRRRTFFIIVFLVALIVVIGIILGAVLGTVLPKKGLNNSDLETWSGTGLASTLSGDGSGRLLMYYQDPDGRIIENSYFYGKWTLENRAHIDSSVVTAQAAYGSQLAAISYKLGGKTYRQVFFVTSTGAVMTTNTSETDNGMAINWSMARSITNDRVDPQGIGLAACWSDELMNGIRLFYPSQYGYIQEMKWTFGGNDTWVEGDEMWHSDSTTGFGCATKNSAADQYLNLYYRHIKTGVVKQAFVDYTNKDVYWSYDDTPTSWSNRTIAIGADIAVCSDDSQSEYVYYQLQGGLVTRGLVNPSSADFETFANQQGATVKSKLACSFTDGGSMLFFQNRTSTSTIFASDVSRSGYTISDFAVP